MKISVICRCLAFILAPVELLGGAANAEQSCAGVYSNAVANISIKTRQTSEYDYVWTKYCENNGELRKESYGVDLSIPLKMLDLTISGDADKSIQKMQQFCKDHRQERIALAESYDYERNIVSSALKSLNECRALELAGLRISHQVQDARSIIVRADFDPAKTKVRFQGITYEPSAGSCFTTGLREDGSPINLNKSTKAADMSGPFSIICERSAVTTKSGSKKFDRFTLGIDTNHGSYSVELPVEEMLGWDLASENKIRFEKLATERAGLESRLASVKADSFMVRQGQIPAGGFWTHVPCPQDGGNLADTVKALCPNKKYNQKTLLSHGGHKCGYTYYAVACIID